MHKFNKFINAVSRCGALYRTRHLALEGVGPYDQSYLFYICRHEGLSQDAIGRALYVNKSSVTRHLSHLEREGYIERRPDEADRRVLLVYPTKKALDALPRLREVAREWNSLLTVGFTEEEQQQLFSLLERALANARAAVDKDAERGGDAT